MKTRYLTISFWAALGRSCGAKWVQVGPKSGVGALLANLSPCCGHVGLKYWNWTMWHLHAKWAKEPGILRWRNSPSCAIYFQTGRFQFFSPQIPIYVIAVSAPWNGAWFFYPGVYAPRIEKFPQFWINILCNIVKNCKLICEEFPQWSPQKITQEPESIPNRHIPQQYPL